FLATANIPLEKRRTSPYLSGDALLLLQTRPADHGFAAGGGAVCHIQKEFVMSQFAATSTTDDVLKGIDLNGKRVLVTGVSAGLGVETARALVAHGAHVVGAARDLAKARDATAGISAQAKNGGGLELIEL